MIVRAAEAVALRAIIAGIIDDPQEGRKGEPLIVLGDLNDDLAAVTTQVVTGDEPPFYWSVGRSNAYGTCSCTAFTTFRRRRATGT